MARCIENAGACVKWGVRDLPSHHTRLHSKTLLGARKATEAPVDFAVERELHDAAAFDDARNDGMDGRDVLLVTSPQDTVVKNVHRT